MYILLLNSANGTIQIRMKRAYSFYITVLLSAFSFYCGGQNTVGFISNSPGSLEGYVLFSPLYSGITYLIDKCGRQVHNWRSPYNPGRSVYLLPNGNLLRSGIDKDRKFKQGAGKVQIYDWNNILLWEYTYSTDREIQHHDIYPMKNGNILMLVWEKFTRDEVIKQGRNPDLLGDELWSEKVVELKPDGADGAKVVWEWRVWDHLVQDFDETGDNYGTVSRSPQLININYNASKEADWLHFNSICYNAELDQVLISNRNFNEIFVIDHGTTTKEAARHTGGKRGHGGDLLYRWGNPASYNMGNKRDQKLYYQHSAQWIEQDSPDKGKIIVFNNGLGRAKPDSLYSSVEIIEPKFNIAGNYLLEPGRPYRPESPYWTYTTPERINFYSFNVSNAQRLSNGNTLICSGEKGYFFEIDRQKNIVWNYINPVGSGGVQKQGDQPFDNQVYRCTLYPSNYSAFKGRILEPGYPIEENPKPYPCELKSDGAKKKLVNRKGKASLYIQSNEQICLISADPEGEFISK